MSSLFDPITIGAIEAPNRIFMAPLTRLRADFSHTPQPLMAQYYQQRAKAGLIIAEATGISKEGLGFPTAPGVWLDEHVEGWKLITEAVHSAGGRIILQLWHMGRLVLKDYNDGKPPVSSSATQAPEKAYAPDGSRKPYDEARPLRLDEIGRLLDDYALAAENAKRAGFDGVQLHAANGYLIDQFIRDGVNFRDDAYGGPIENRIRLLGEVVQRLIDIWGKEYVHVRLSPNGNTQGVNDSNPQETFPAAAALLDKIGIASLELREPPMDGTFGKSEYPPIAPAIRKNFSRTLILNSDYLPDRAMKTMEEGLADAISFGRTYIANPDLVERIKQNAPLNKDNIKTWYIPGPEGYIDYPTLEQESLLA
jgi:2,4-dienoyl-CoA reductase-like NADH-dependent reductase (Old Yellow Enzyme family)